MGRMTLITGDERRRRWSEEDRTRILAAISEPGAVVAEVARREDICTSLVYKWRREARRTTSAGASGFSPVIIETPPLPSLPLPPANGSEPGVIEVELKGVRVRISADAPSAVIAATLKALRS
jgi:transposase